MSAKGPDHLRSRIGSDTADKEVTVYGTRHLIGSAGGAEGMLMFRIYPKPFSTPGGIGASMLANFDEMQLEVLLAAREHDPPSYGIDAALGQPSSRYVVLYKGPLEFTRAKVVAMMRGDMMIDPKVVEETFTDCPTVTEEIR